MVLTNIRMKIPPQKREEALRVLRYTAEGNRILPGCLSFRIYEDLQEDNVIMVEEFWKSQEDLERHLRSDEYQKLLLIMEMALQQPEIRFSRIAEESGIETIEKVRTKPSRGKKS
jgi:quinol monooxygenase YgiN